MSKCRYCDEGDVPKPLDKDGMASGEDEILSHASDIHWWPCQNIIESAVDYSAAIAECEALIDLDPEPESLEGRRLAAWVAVIEYYESQIMAAIKKRKAGIGLIAAMKELLEKERELKL